MRAALPVLSILSVLLAACAQEAEAPGAREGVLTLTVTGAETIAEGSACAFETAGANRIGRDALNVQAAYTAETDGRGIQSEYSVLGDFPEGETRAVRLFLSGAPCESVRTLRLTRAACSLRDEDGAVESCADLVVLDGGGVVALRED